MATKIFVFGSLNGQLRSAFSKLATLHAKNNFDFAIVAGELFANFAPRGGPVDVHVNDDAVNGLLDGTIKVPLPVYFTVNQLILPDRIRDKLAAEEDLCENLHFIGNHSVITTSEGVRIVALGGMQVPGAGGAPISAYHTADDARALIRGAVSADILLTTAWPSSVWRGSKIKPPVDAEDIPALDHVADLCAALKPKYHFAMTYTETDFFYEREPFFHPAGDDGMVSNKVTRFISLASFGNASKTKSMYAFALQKEPAASLPVDATPSPFALIKKSKKRQADDFDEGNGNGSGGDGGFSRFSHTHAEDNRQNKKRRNRSPPPGPDKCYFCLSNPNLPQHMVSSIGEEAYLETAKGPLPTSDTFSRQGLDFPCHLIIAPFSHASTLTSAAMGQEDAARAFMEMSRFRESLQAMVSTRSKRVLGSVTWEINRRRGIHTHWQFMPVPTVLIKEGVVETTFQAEAYNAHLPKIEEADFGMGDEVDGDYFRVWLFAEEEDHIISKSLVMPIDEKVRFDLQFGRKVMAKLLQLHNRVVWQECPQTVEEETRDADAFRAAYKPWDFTAPW